MASNPFKEVSTGTSNPFEELAREHSTDKSTPNPFQQLSREQELSTSIEDVNPFAKAASETRRAERELDLEGIKAQEYVERFAEGDVAAIHEAAKPRDASWFDADWDGPTPEQAYAANTSKEMLDEDAERETVGIFGSISTGVQEAFWQTARTANNIYEYFVHRPAAAIEDALPLGTDFVKESMMNPEAADENLKSMVDALPEREGMTAEFTHTMTQFMVPYMGAAKGVQAAGRAMDSTALADRIGRSYVAGAITDMSAFDPYEDRLSDMLAQMDNPVFSNVVTEGLSSDEDDDVWLARMKQAAEGTLMAGAVEGVFHLGRLAKASRKARASNNVKKLDKTISNIEDAVGYYRKSGLTQKAATARVMREYNLTEESIEGMVRKTGRKLRAKTAPEKTIRHVSREMKRRTERAMDGAAEVLIKPWYDRALAPMSTVLSNIHPTLGASVRRFEYDTLAARKEARDSVEPFVNKMTRIKSKDKKLYKELNDALVRNDMGKFREKAPNDVVEEFMATVRPTLDRFHEEQVASGIDIGYRASYFPRFVKDYDKLARHKGYDAKHTIAKAISDAQKKNGGSLDPIEADAVYNRALNAAMRTRLTGTTTDATKSRVFDVLDESDTPYYMDAIRSLYRYLDTASNNMVKRKYLGKSNPDTDTVDFSLGSFGQQARKLMDAGEINQNDFDKFSRLLAVRFGKGESSGARWASGVRNTMYTALLANPFSAMIQLPDNIIAMYKNGTVPTLKSTIRGNRQFNIQRDFGIDRINEELATLESTSKLLQKTFKWSGFRFTDHLAKNTHINSSFHKHSKMVQTAAGERKFRDTWRHHFTEQEMEDTIRAFKEGRVDSGVKYTMMSDLLDVQPLVRSEMPEFYNAYPNARMLYMLQSFTLKQMDIMRRDGFRKINEGAVADGVYDIGRYATMLSVANVTVEELQRMLATREDFRTEELSDPNRIFFGFMRNFGVNEYVVNQTQRDGLLQSVSLNAIAPPIGPADDLVNDLGRFGRGLVSTSLGEEFEDLSDWKSLRYTPVLGRLSYMWFGGGAEQLIEREERQEREREREELQEWLGE